MHLRVLVVLLAAASACAPEPKVLCDSRQVTCRSEPPPCARYEFASVENGCWGDCVDFGECLPIPCEDTPDESRQCSPELRCNKPEEPSSGECIPL